MYKAYIYHVYEQVSPKNEAVCAYNFFFYIPMLLNSQLSNFRGRKLYSQGKKMELEEIRTERMKEQWVGSRSQWNIECEKPSMFLWSLETQNYLCNL